MGSFVGRCDAHVDWLMDEACRPFELADAYAFVRRDLSADLVAADARRMRGELTAPPDPRTAGGLANLNHLAAYVRSSLRNAHHFYTEGHALMLLTWAEELARQYRTLRAGEPLDRDITALCTSLMQIECVQRLEKSRFYAIWERLPATPLREHMTRLWTASLTGA
jgi:hypothetical protein